MHNLKVYLKYKLKSKNVQLASQKISVEERETLYKSVTKATDFWVDFLCAGFNQLETEQEKYQRVQEITSFEHYLKTNILYDLLVKKEECFYLHKGEKCLEGLSESERDSCAPTSKLPFKTYMYVYKNKVILNGSIYYDKTYEKEVDRSREDTYNLPVKKFIKQMSTPKKHKKEK